MRRDRETALDARHDRRDPDAEHEVDDGAAVRASMALAVYVSI